MKNYLSIIFLTVLGFSVKAQKLSIGQPYQGGIIFYLDSLKQFGLIAAEKDLNPETIEKGVFPYYCLPCYGSFVADSTDTIIGSGKQNSINLLTRCPTLNSLVVV